MHHAVRTANVELVVTTLQHRRQMVDSDMAFDVIVDPDTAFLGGTAVEVQATQVALRLTQHLKMVDHDVLGTVADTVEQPDFPLRLRPQHPVEHAYDRRNTDAAGNEDDRSLG